MQVGIIGVGMVGGAMRHGFNLVGREVLVHDPRLPETTLAGALKAPIVFVCVPTPARKDGSCDTSIVEKVVGEIAQKKYKGLVVIKSTVEPGTTDRLAKKHRGLRIAFCPEFLREKAAFADFTENHDVCIVGTRSKKDFELVQKAHEPLPKQYAQVAPIEAELAKYFFNAFNALRIMYANQFFDLCKALGADYNAMKNAMTKHRFMPETYLACHENLRGFGGACLPKDTSALKELAKRLLKGKTPLLDAIVETNKLYRTTVL